MSFSEWKECNFEDILYIPIRNGLSKPKAVRGDGVKMVNMGEIFKYDRIFDIEMDRVPTTEKEFLNSKLEKGDLLFARQSLVWEGAGKCSIIMEANEDLVYESHLIRARLDQKQANSWFYYYYFKSHYGKENIRSIVEQVAAAGIRGSDLIKLKIPLPPIKEQKAIADTLSCLDNKIELNNLINKTLEEMAQAIFKSWFVDFKPFQNGDFEDSELGKIPKGWKVDTLENHVVSIDNRGKTPPLATQMTIYPIIDVKALSGESRIIDYKNYTKYVEEDTYNNWFRSGHPKQHDILISTVGSLAEMKLFYGDKGCTAQNVVAFRSKDLSPLYLYQYLKHIRSDLISYNIGSVQPSIKVTHIIKHKILIPSKTQLKLFESTISEISNTIFKNFEENQTLIAIQNTLLPKLMSGEIRVPTEEV